MNACPIKRGEGQLQLRAGGRVACHRLKPGLRFAHQSSTTDWARVSVALHAWAPRLPACLPAFVSSSLTTPPHHHPPTPHTMAFRMAPLKLSAAAGSPHLRLMATGARNFHVGE